MKTPCQAPSPAFSYAKAVQIRTRILPPEQAGTEAVHDEAAKHNLDLPDELILEE